MQKTNNESQNLSTQQSGSSTSSPLNYVTYITTNDITNEQYVGVFSYKEGDRKDIYKYQYYIGNGILHPNQAEKMKPNQFIKSVIKYGYENFTREDLFITTDKQAAYDYEAELCDEAWVNKPNTLNNRTGGNTNVTVSRVTRERQSKAQLKSNAMAKKCIDTTTGVEYNSVAQCAAAIKMPATTLRHQISKYKEAHFIKLI